MCSQTFLYEIQLQTTCIWIFSWYDAYFWQRWALKWIYFSVFLHYNISKMRIFRTLLLHSGGRYTYALPNFFVWNSITNNIYLNLFLMRCLFLAASSPKVNLLFCFSTLQYSKNGYLSRSLAPLCGEIDLCAARLFFMKLNYKQRIFESFLDAMLIFDSVDPWSESTFPFFYIIIFQKCVIFRTLLLHSGGR